MAAAAPQHYMHLQHHHHYQQAGATPKAASHPAHGPASCIVFAPGVVGNAHAITLRLSKSEDERSRRRLYNPRGEASYSPRREASTANPSHSTNTAHARKSSSSSLPDTRPPSPHIDSVPYLSSSAPTSRPTSPTPLTIRIRKEDHVAYIEKRAQSDAAVRDVTELMGDALTLAEPSGIDALARAMGRQLRVEGPMDSEDDDDEDGHLPKPSRMRQLELTVETNLFLAEVAKELTGMPDKRPMFGEQTQGVSPGKRKLSVFYADHESLDEEMEDIDGPRRRKIARLPSAGHSGPPNTMSSLPLTLAATAALAYFALVRALRWRKYDTVHRKYAHKLRDKTLSPTEAQEIVQLSLGYDMHYIMTMALSFALFKTYGIPSISKLLLATKELSTRDNVAKRIIDTELLIGRLYLPVTILRAHSELSSIAAWTHCPINGHYPGAVTAPCDPRAMLSMARVNWLHSKYHISNDDFLYTLSLFIFEPLTWAEKYGWRPCSDLEKHAWFVYWSEIGKRMNIHDIPATFDELKRWSVMLHWQAYEEKHLVPSPTNFEVAKHSVEEILYRVPNAFGLKRFARRLSVASLIEPALSPVDPTSGLVRRMHPRKFPSKPWYMPEPSNLLSALAVRLQVWLGVYEAAPGPQFKSEGYYLHEMGPLKFERDGRIETLKAAEEFLGCPVPGPWVKAVGAKETPQS
ncbi:uncharacterized protein SCHCODRAFT_01096190 [Schizophyllum commune H4-8]|uniref:ER-bound oxygenase mpaB/mpaB'/Rubber oxygenase catalytic domain-containing protein n=1 Tax=Schizophyllum commune (strain H4-8 / FGSC 9210) TaxID=578458 RepID=D8Q7A8_SCHCM|nr:uncharacterized protein SCHCODRAFT_01096190 [Schizophyllum commune H4-8]KAI5891574.1 hypothetical protein SCHCODRAFT_01096190 [Schizophyllum commune H4-8]